MASLRRPSLTSQNSNPPSPPPPTTPQPLRMNELPDDMLSAFMITRVFGKTLVAGVVQGAFLLLDGIRCTLRVRGDGKLHRECSRTLFGEVGIGCMLTLLLIALLMSGLVPKKHLEKLEIPMKKIVTGELQRREIVRILLVLLTTMCTLFLVGYYGTTGDFKDDTELHIAIGFLVTGLTTLVVLLLWVFWEILSAVRAEEQELGRHPALRGAKRRAVRAF